MTIVKLSKVLSCNGHLPRIKEIRKKVKDLRKKRKLSKNGEGLLSSSKCI